jgi:hypothetical protein
VLKSQVEIRQMMKEPSAFVPVAMSVAAIALVVVKVLGDLATHGTVVHEADEGGAAHLWQLLMAGQAPVLAFFAIKWLPRAPKQALYILALQTGVALTSLAAMFFLRL